MYIHTCYPLSAAVKHAAFIHSVSENPGASVPVHPKNVGIAVTATATATHARTLYTHARKRTHTPNACLIVPSAQHMLLCTRA